MAKGSLRVNGIIVDSDGEIKASTGDSIVIREDDGSAVITVDTSGNVGINTTAPGAQFDIRGPAGTGSASASVLRMSTAETSVVDADQLGRIEFIAPLETQTGDARLVGASIHAEADDTFAADNNSTELVFSTGASEAATEKMRIDSAGNVGIGTTSPVAPLTVQSNINAEAVKILGRSADDIGQMLFVEADGTTRLGRIDARTTYLDFASDSALYLSAGGVGTQSIVINSSGNVGIGTTAPDGTLHIHTGSAGSITADSNSNNLVVENSADAGISILSPQGNYQRLYFGHDADVDAGQIIYGGANVGYAGNRNHMIFYANGSEKMRITSDGNVGIGSAIPNKTLVVESTSGTAGTPNGIKLSNLVHGSNSQIYMYAENDSGTQKSASISLDPDATNFYLRGAGGGDDIAIDSSGNVGIGTTAPLDNLHLIGTLRIGESTTSTHATNAGTAFEIRGDALASGSTDIDAFKAFKIAHNDGSEYGGQAQFSLGRWEENGSDARSTLVISLGHGGLNSSTNADLDVMTLRSDGRVGLGTTAPGTLLHVRDSSTTGACARFDGGCGDSIIYTGGNNSSGKGEIQLGSTSSYHGTILYTDNGSTEFFIHNNYQGNASAAITLRTGSSGGVKLERNSTSFASASDERMKDIHSSITGGIEKLSNVRTVVGSFKTSPEKREPMLIAQDFIDILPEAVTKSPPSEHEDDGIPEDGAWQLSYTATIPLLINAIKELSEKVKALESAG